MSSEVAIVAGTGSALGHATAAPLAVGDPAAAASLSTASPARLGPGVLVSTIGAFRPGDRLTTAPETLRLMLDVNLGAALWLSRAFAPHMQQ